MSNVKSFTVHRPTWLRGGKPVLGSALLFNGRRCCLGFLGRACGYTDLELTRICTPGGAIYKTGKDLWPEPLSNPSERCSQEQPTETLVHYPQLKHDMMTVNDDETLNDTEREEQLTDLFAQAGITVTFTDEPELQKP